MSKLILFAVLALFAVFADSTPLTTKDDASTTAELGAKKMNASAALMAPSMPRQAAPSYMYPSGAYSSTGYAWPQFYSYPSWGSAAYSAPMISANSISSSQLTKPVSSNMYDLYSPNLYLRTGGSNTGNLANIIDSKTASHYRPQLYQAPQYYYATTTPYSSYQQSGHSYLSAYQPASMLQQPTYYGTYGHSMYKSGDAAGAIPTSTAAAAITMQPADASAGYPAATLLVEKPTTLAGEIDGSLLPVDETARNSYSLPSAPQAWLPSPTAGGIDWTVPKTSYGFSQLDDLRRQQDIFFDDKFNMRSQPVYYLDRLRAQQPNHVQFSEQPLTLGRSADASGEYLNSLQFTAGSGFQQPFGSAFETYYVMKPYNQQEVSPLSGKAATATADEVQRVWGPQQAQWGYPMMSRGGYDANVPYSHENIVKMMQNAFLQQFMTEADQSGQHQSGQQTVGRVNPASAASSRSSVGDSNDGPEILKKLVQKIEQSSSNNASGMTGSGNQPTKGDKKEISPEMKTPEVTGA